MLDGKLLERIEVLRVLDVGILDVPIPSPPEHAALGSMSLPSTPFASSLVSGSSAPAQCRMLLWQLLGRLSL